MNNPKALTRDAINEYKRNLLIQALGKNNEIVNSIPVPKVDTSFMSDDGIKKKKVEYPAAYLAKLAAMEKKVSSAS